MEDFYELQSDWFLFVEQSLHQSGEQRLLLDELLPARVVVVDLVARELLVDGLVETEHCLGLVSVSERADWLHGQLGSRLGYVCESQDHFHVSVCVLLSLHELVDLRGLLAG